MKNIQVGIKKGLSWVLTAALTVGFVSAAGVTVGADTVTLAESEKKAGRGAAGRRRLSYGRRGRGKYGGEHGGSGSGSGYRFKCEA